MKRAKPDKMPASMPGVDVGDEIYVKHQAGPCAGRVVAHGAHGVTLDIDGAHHKIRWEHVLGHKKRVAQEYEVVDEGEDGMIVKDASGRHRFMGIPPEARENKMVLKALDGGKRLLLFVKSESSGDGPMSNRPGLSKKEITDRTGRRQTKWVRTQKAAPAERKPAQEDAGASNGYGTHNLETGDTVNFKAGDFEGTGKIVGEPGKDGAHVRDASGRVHQVHWAEITGHDKNGTQKPAVDREVNGAQKPIAPDQFKAADYAKQHDQADVTADDILSHFPADTKDKIKEVQERLQSIEQTIDQHKDGDDYSTERDAIHKKIYDHFLSPERVEAATPAEGEKPTFTILGGRGGSGKSWLKGKVYDPDKAIVVDADDIKGMLPEYEGWNAAQVHEESSDIMNNILMLSRQTGLNVVLDGTLNTSKSALQKVTAFKDAGYRVEAHYMHLPRQEAAKRAVSRFLGKTNRYVPVDVVLANRKNEENFDEVRKHADKWSFRDNNVEQGKEPILISEGGADHKGEKSQQKSDGPLTKSDHGHIIMLWKEKAL